MEFRQLLGNFCGNWATFRPPTSGHTESALKFSAAKAGRLFRSLQADEIGMTTHVLARQVDDASELGRVERVVGELGVALVGVRRVVSLVLRVDLWWSTCCRAFLRGNIETLHLRKMAVAKVRPFKLKRTVLKPTNLANSTSISIVVFGSLDFCTF